MSRAADNAEDWEAALGYRFADRTWLWRAVTHPSYAQEHPEAGAHYQRLEFLGDSLVGAVVAHRLFERFTGVDEGRLSRLRSHLVSTESLAAIAKEAGYDGWLRVGRGQARAGERAQHGLAADVFEALTAAIYIDGGFAEAEAFVVRHMAQRIDEVASESEIVDAKTRLQELTQARHRERPVYEVEAVGGPAHAPVFTARACLFGRVLGEGQGTSKKSAQQAAAAAALLALEDSTP